MAEKELAVTERNLTAVDIRKQVNLIQEVMHNVMKKDEHFGIIPGCKKPSLYKPGAEKLMLTFRLGAKFEELPGSREGDDLILYKINCELFHIPTGNIIGNGRGTCSSKEKKYRTRMVYENKASDEEKAIGKLEERTGEGGKKYKVYIVPQDPWDVQNTLYKMACKRAQVAAVLNATAASDIFTQDIEDLPEGTIIDETAGKGKPAVDMPQSKSAAKPEVKILNIIDALQAKIGETINVRGQILSYKERQPQGKDITDYTLGNETETDQVIKISRWGKLHSGSQSGDMAIFTGVVVSEYNKEKKFTAQEIAIELPEETNA